MKALDKSKAGAPAISVIDPEVATADPEATDMFNYLVFKPDFISKPDFNELATLVLKYPDNEFFAYELANKLDRTDNINPRATRIIIERLIDANQQKAQYHYFRAMLLLESKNEVLFKEGLNEVQKGNNVSEFNSAYGKYRQRIRTMLKTASQSELQMRLLEPPEMGLYYQLLKSLSDEIKLTFPI